MKSKRNYSSFSKILVLLKTHVEAFILLIALCVLTCSGATSNFHLLYVTVGHLPGQEIRIISNSFLQLSAHLNAQVLQLKKQLQFVSYAVCQLERVDILSTTVQGFHKHCRLPAFGSLKLIKALS